GVIGFCVLSEESAQVESFFMSCRVQRKRVENAFFQFLAGELASRGARSLEVAYKRTAKNRATVDMLAELGFDYEPRGIDEGAFVTPLPRDFSESDVVRIRSHFQGEPAQPEVCDPRRVA